MQECCSPWLVNLVATAQDSKNVYMLLEAIMGGELFAYLQARAVLQAVTACCARRLLLSLRLCGATTEGMPPGMSATQTRRAPLPESHARFYVASVVLALEYLHERNLVYRGGAHRCACGSAHCCCRERGLQA